MYVCMYVCKSLYVNLCLYEKFIIICKKELCSLNRRNELASSCPHRNRYVLQNSRVT